MNFSAKEVKGLEAAKKKEQGSDKNKCTKRSSRAFLSMTQTVTQLVDTTSLIKSS